MQFGSNAKAGHLVGGEMNYRCLGNNSYEIKLILYRDCNGVGAPFDPIAKVGIFRGGNSTLLSQLNVPLPGFTTVPINTVSSCLVVPPSVCLQEAIYVDTVTLLPSLTGYNIVYQRCCRNPSITNIVSPATAGNTYHSFIPPNDTSCNSSPSFNNFPPVLLCVNDPLNFDHSATDLDGDSLVYEFFTPFTGGTNINPAPNPSAPPFTTINWGPTFSVTNQVTSSPQISINSATGLITGTPTAPGQYVVGVLVKEFRNGVLVSETKRDFQFNILNCIRAISSIFDPGVVCDSYLVNFNNLSINATSYLWDFGDGNTLADTSIAQNPSYTYPDTGVYRVRLIVDPYSTICSDTSFLDLRVFPVLRPFFSAPNNQCFKNNSFDFRASGGFTPTTQIDWSLGTNALPATFRDSVVNGVSYSVGGLKTITVRYREFGCDTSYSDTLRVYQEIESIIDSLTTGCDTYLANFTNSSLNAQSYDWDFGVLGTNADRSSQSSPTYTYADTGVYNVRLIVAGEGGCKDTANRIARIFPLLLADFQVPDNQCFRDNEFSFAAQGTYFPTTQIDWNFGTGASLATSNRLFEPRISYANSGVKTVRLRYRDFGCDTSFSTNFIVYPEIMANFTTQIDTVCVGDVVPIEFSTTTSPSFNFDWDFGDGETSRAKSPRHIYTRSGTYTVRFIASDANCADTLIIPSVVTILPSPTARFTPRILIVPNYASEVYFENQSLDFVTSTFLFGDGNQVSPFATSLHQYARDGYFYPELVVENELGCKDSIQGKILVKSELYIPNSFTPNEDGVNDFFKPVLSDPDEYVLLIFNRWGEVVFESTNSDEAWNGKYKGEWVKNDTYIYRLTYNYEIDKPQVVTGHVNVVR